MIELNGVQISDNNINTKKNVKIYVDEKQLDRKVGELQDLETTNKSSIVNAINEIKNTTNTLQVDVNRIYSDFTIIPNTPTEQEFTYKKSDEGVIEKGVAVIDKVKGNSVVWNQQCKVTSGSFSMSNLSIVASENGVLVNGTASQITVLSLVTSCPTARVVGHKYLIKGCPSGGSNSTYSFRYNSNGFGENGTGKIVTCVAAGTSVTDNQMLETYVPVICISKGVKCNNLLFRPRIIDLTQMFGANNEPTTYEEFLSRKPNVENEYAYNEGTIVNNKVEKVVTTGRNLFDSSTAIDGKTILDTSSIEVNNSLGWCSTFIPIIGGESYFCKGVIAEGYAYGVHIYDKDKQSIYKFSIPINGKIFVTPINSKYIRIHGRYDDSPANTAILNLSDASFNGQYAPYEKHELDLSWIKDIKDAEGMKLFEDGMRSAGTAFDETAKGRAIKRIGVVNLGNLNWEPGVQTGQYKTSDFKQLRPSAHKSLVCANYTTRKDGGNMQNDSKDLWVWNNVGGGSGYYPEVLVAKDTRYSSAQAFKQAVQGVLLYYELAEPIEVEYDEKNLTYPVVVGGTEEAVASEPSTPMRASITYGSNTVATILSLMNRVNELERKIIN